MPILNAVCLFHCLKNNNNYYAVLYRSCVLLVVVRTVGYYGYNSVVSWCSLLLLLPAAWCEQKQKSTAIQINVVKRVTIPANIHFVFLLITNVLSQ